MLKRLFDLFIFSSFYIALCAALMVYQANHLLQLHYKRYPFYIFVFFSTLCSYNLHWYLTPRSETEIIRIRWSRQHTFLHLVLTGIGLVVSTWFFFQLNEHWIWLTGAVFFTFLYTAPKIPLVILRQLRKIAVGKTIFLAFVWMYVTSVLPLILSGKNWNWSGILFCISRFFLIYSICIIFDYRDRQNDMKEGIRSMVTYLNESGINKLFYSSIIIFAISTSALFFVGFNLITTMILIIPGIITLFLYDRAKRSFSDYLYYFILDGLMMVSALFTSFMPN